MSRNFLRPLEAISRQCRPRGVPVQITQSILQTTRYAAPFHTTPQQYRKPQPPKTPPPTSFEELDVLGNTPIPATAIDNCLDTGFILNGGVKVTDGSGVLLANGEAFRWRPWEVTGRKELVNKKGQFEVPAEAFGVLDLLWPRPGKLAPVVACPSRVCARSLTSCYRHRLVDIRRWPAHRAAQSRDEKGH